MHLSCRASLPAARRRASKLAFRLPFLRDVRTAGPQPAVRTTLKYKSLTRSVRLKSYHLGLSVYSIRPRVIIKVFIRGLFCATMMSRFSARYAAFGGGRGDHSPCRPG